jgi:hypothetical protein
MQPDPARRHSCSSVREESLDVEGVDYGAARRDGDLVDARIDEEEDIDLSEALAKLDPEEPSGARAASADRLFDGEPVGVYDGSGDGRRRRRQRARCARLRQADAEAADPHSPRKRSPSSSSKPTDLEAESSASSVASRWPITTRRSRAPSKEEVAGTPVADALEAEAIGAEIVPSEAAPEPADAEAWGSLFLSPRWAWPAMEGVPTEPPPAAVAVEAVAAATMPTAARLPALAAARPAAIRPPPSEARRGAPSSGAGWSPRCARTSSAGASSRRR